VRQNTVAAGLGERGTDFCKYFRRAFHGRSGYTMSLTNTGSATDLSAKFTGRALQTTHRFRSRCGKRETDVIEREKKSEREIMAKFIAERVSTIAAIIIIEPIQAKAAIIIFAANGCKRFGAFVTRTKCFSFSTKCNAAPATGRNWCCEHSSTSCLICLPSEKRSRSAARPVRDLMKFAATTSLACPVESPDPRNHRHGAFNDIICASWRREKGG